MEPYFPIVSNKIALLDGCDIQCPVHEKNGRLYANTGPLLRLLTPAGSAYQDSDGRHWSVATLTDPGGSNG